MKRNKIYALKGWKTPQVVLSIIASGPAIYWTGRLIHILIPTFRPTPTMEHYLDNLVTGTVTIIILTGTGLATFLICTSLKAITRKIIEAATKDWRQFKSHWNLNQK